MVGLILGFKTANYIRPLPVDNVPQVQEKAKEQKKVLKKKTTTTVIKKADGTVIEKKEDSSSDSQTEKQNEKTVSPYSPSRYALDVTVNPKNPKDAKIGGSVRIGNTPLHGVVEYEIQEREARVGLRAEF